LTGYAAFLRLYIHQHDIRTHSADAPPRDHIIISPAPKTEKTARTGDDDGRNFSFRQFDPGIADIA
jgi:hypothetical protein